MEIAGKVALITGASRGIGAACVEAFRRRGALLSITARSADLLARVGGAGALTTAGDLLDESFRRLLIDRTVQHYGRIDILINNAGAGMYLPVHQAPMATVRTLFDLNFFAPVDLVQRVVPIMRQQGGGAIVNVGSMAGLITLPWFTLYSSSKFALGSFTQGIRMELRRYGIHAMVVCPGYVDTEFQSNVLAGKPPEIMRRGRRLTITPERCAEDLARGLERDARTVVTPAAGWFLVGLNRLLPAVVEGVLRRTGAREIPSA